MPKQFDLEGRISQQVVLENLKGKQEFWFLHYSITKNQSKMADRPDHKGYNNKATRTKYRRISLQPWGRQTVLGKDTESMDQKRKNRLS